MIFTGSSERFRIVSFNDHSLANWYKNLSYCIAREYILYHPFPAPSVDASLTRIWDKLEIKVEQADDSQPESRSPPQQVKQYDPVHVRVREGEYSREEMMRLKEVVGGSVRFCFLFFPFPFSRPLVPAFSYYQFRSYHLYSILLLPV